MSTPIAVSIQYKLVLEAADFRAIFSQARNWPSWFLSLSPRFTTENGHLVLYEVAGERDCPEVHEQLIEFLSDLIGRPNSLTDEAGRAPRRGPTTIEGFNQAIEAGLPDEIDIYRASRDAGVRKRIDVARIALECVRKSLGLPPATN